MAVSSVQYRMNIESYLIGIGKGVGVEFKDDTHSLRQSNSFREQMKQKQRMNKEKRKNG